MYDEQRGAVTLAQVRAHGLSERTVQRRVARGIWERPFRGVYLRPPYADHADALRCAAALAAGSRALVSHASAAKWWRLDGAPQDPIPEVTVPHGWRAPALEGVRVRRSRHPEPVPSGAPVTSVARTLVDLAPSCRPPRLRLLAGDALRRGLVTPAGVAVAVAGAGPRCGAGPLLAMLESLDSRCESALEQDLLDLIRSAGLPEPVPQWLVEDGLGWYCHLDLAWPDLLLAAQADGFAHHGSHAAFLADRRLDRRLAALGWLVVRFSWDDVGGRPGEVARTLATLIEHRRRGATG